MARTTKSTRPSTSPTPRLKTKAQLKAAPATGGTMQSWPRVQATKVAPTAVKAKPGLKTRWQLKNALPTGGTMVPHDRVQRRPATTAPPPVKKTGLKTRKERRETPVWCPNMIAGSPRRRPAPAPKPPVAEKPKVQLKTRWQRINAPATGGVMMPCQ